MHPKDTKIKTLNVPAECQWVSVHFSKDVVHDHLRFVRGFEFELTLGWIHVKADANGEVTIIGLTRVEDFTRGNTYVIELSTASLREILDHLKEHPLDLDAMRDELIPHQYDTERDLSQNVTLPDRIITKPSSHDSLFGHRLRALGGKKGRSFGNETS